MKRMILGFLVLVGLSSACGEAFQAGSVQNTVSGGGTMTTGTDTSSSSNTTGGSAGAGGTLTGAGGVGGTSNTGGTAGHGGATTTSFEDGGVTTDAGDDGGDAGCTVGTSKPCYTGDQQTLGKGICHSGTQICNNKGEYGACEGESLPSAETCDGADNDCDGVVDNGCDCKDGSKQACYSGPGGTSGVGACHNGLQTCESGFWSTCEGEVTPSIEICNGVDDDCNNAVDDDLGQTTCGKGPCMVTVQNCKNNKPEQCVPLASSPEICDGIDNNCDGKTDEGCSCKDNDKQYCYNGPAGTNNVGACHGGTQTCKNGVWPPCEGEVVPSDETCDGNDNDCNGQTDDGLGQTTCGKGPCTVTVQNCIAGKPQQCTPLAGSIEVCDGVDNDCNGQTDENCSCKNGDTQPCYSGPVGTISVGVCHGGTQTCNLAGVFGLCEGEVVPSIEICDGADNDCDGKTDEDLGQTSCGLGLCKVTIDNCIGGKPQQCVPKQGSPETCDGIDNDCDGVVDNGCPCVVGGPTQNCYGGPPGTKGVGVCKGGTQTCQPGGWGVCVGEVLPSAETCNGADDNCNGQTDENLGQTTCGSGLCTNTVDNCKAGKPQQCVPKQGSPETCDGIDNNCDGQIDEGCIGCADGSVEQIYSPTMHGCDGSVAQCTANTLCKQGYHLCTFSEYVAQGGTSTPPSAQRWIASCIRENCGAPHAPTNSVCGNCSFASGSSAQIQWDCNSSPTSTDGNCNMGVFSFSQKRILGNAQGTCAHNTFNSPNNQGGAMCCVN